MLHEYLAKKKKMLYLGLDVELCGWSYYDVEKMLRWCDVEKMMWRGEMMRCWDDEMLISIPYSTTYDPEYILRIHPNPLTFDPFIACPQLSGKRGRMKGWGRMGSIWPWSRLIILMMIVVRWCQDDVDELSFRKHCVWKWYFFWGVCRLINSSFPSPSLTHIPSTSWCH